MTKNHVIDIARGLKYRCENNSLSAFRAINKTQIFPNKLFISFSLVEVLIVSRLPDVLNELSRKQSIYMQHLMMLNVISIICIWHQIMLTEYNARTSEKKMNNFLWTVFFMTWVLMLYFFISVVYAVSTSIVNDVCTS